MTLCPFLCKIKYSWVQKREWMYTRETRWTAEITRSSQCWKCPISLSPKIHTSEQWDLHFDVNSHLYSLEHTHKSSNPLCFWSTDSFSFPSGRTKNLDGYQRPIRMDPTDQTSAVHWIPHTGHNTESTCNHFFPLKSQHYFIISESHVTAWWKWEHRSGPQKYSINSHCKRNINFSIHQTILPPNE